MLKRLSVALAAVFVLASSAFAAGTLPGFSLSQQMGTDGKPLAGCKLYIIQAGTTSTPQTAYQDSALTIPAPGGSQLTCDAAGRIGQFFLADGSIKIRLTDVNGVTQVTADGLLVVGPSGGGGGGASVDPTTILATGDLKVSYGTGILTGFVRANGRNIGSATSGATERANSDTQALFQYLWGADANLTVSGGRGVSAAADWAANKTITLPDWRGRALAGLDDMGSTAAGRLTATYFGCTATVLGCAGGAESQTLTQAQIPAHFHTASISDPGHTHPVTGGIYGGTTTSGFSTGAISVPQAASLIALTPVVTNVRINSANGLDTTSTIGGGGAHPIASPMMLATIFIKL